MRSFDELFTNLPSEGWLSRAEAELLLRSAAMTTGDILEVGCYCGRSTVLLASLGRKIYAVDPFDGFNDDLGGDGVAKKFADSMAYFDVRCVELFRMRVEEWKPRPVGFAYLDGDHTYEGTLAQIAVAKACGAKVIAIHDVNDQGEGVKVRDAAMVGMGDRWQQRAERLAVWTLV